MKSNRFIYLDNLDKIGNSKQSIDPSHCRRFRLFYRHKDFVAAPETKRCKYTFILNEKKHIDFLQKEVNFSTLTFQIMAYKHFFAYFLALKPS